MNKLDFEQLRKIEMLLLNLVAETEHTMFSNNKFPNEEILNLNSTAFNALLTIEKMVSDYNLNEMRG